jgi:hypothetical protein
VGNFSQSFWINAAALVAAGHLDLDQTGAVNCGIARNIFKRISGALPFTA